MLIELGGRPVEYRFARRRRRTLGITVDADGLRVAAPMRAPWREVEAFLREKERWILAKLDEWALAPRPALVHGVTGERLPLFGEVVGLERRAGAVRREAGQWLGRPALDPEEVARWADAYSARFRSVPVRSAAEVLELLRDHGFRVDRCDSAAAAARSKGGAVSGPTTAEAADYVRVVATRE